MKLRNPLIILLIVLGALSHGAVTLAGGKLLGDNVEVTDEGLGDLVDAKYPDVAANGYRVYAVWEDYRDTWDEAEIYLARSTNGGATWGANVNVSQGEDNVIGLGDPAVAADSTGWVYVIWNNPAPPDPAEYAVYMSRSSDNGASFETPWMLGYIADEGFSFKPQIAVEPTGGYVYVVINAPYTTDSYDIYLARSADHGETWPGGWHKISDGDGSGAGDEIYQGPEMTIVADGDVVCAAWEDGRDGTARIYGDCSTDHGQTWGTDFAISPTGVEALWPTLALGPTGDLYAAYEADGEVFVRRSTDRGDSWSTAVQVSSVPTGDELGRWDLAVDDNGTVAVLWAEGDWGTFGASNLYLSTSIDNGQTFTPLHVEDSGNLYYQYSPAIAVYGSGDYARAVMVWGDDRNTHEEIWSARAELDATPPTAPSDLQATPGDTVVDLTWTASTDRNGISGYYVIRATQSGGPYTVLNPFILTDTAYRDVGLGSGTYYYKVYAVDGAGNVGSTSNEVSVVVTAGSDLPIDGTIAYESDGDIRLRDLPSLGSERTLAQGYAPHFSPDGSRVYYYSSDAILSRPVGGGDAQGHYADDDLTAHFDLPADTSYFARIEEQFYAGTEPGQWCYAYEPRYGPFNGDDLYAATTTMGQGVTISSDRHWLAYTTVGYCGPAAQGQYEVMNLCLVNLTTQAKTCYSDADYQNPAFAPSGWRLLFAADFDGRYEIWRATVTDDGGLTDLTRLTRDDELWSLEPAWSSDGNWAIFARGTPSGSDIRLPGLQNPYLYVVRSDGAFLRPLNVPGESPAWHGTGSAPPVTYNHFAYLPLVLRTYR